MQHFWAHHRAVQCQGLDKHTGLTRSMHARLLARNVEWSATEAYRAP